MEILKPVPPADSPRRRGFLRMPLLMVVVSAGLLAIAAALALMAENRSHTLEAAHRDNSNIARLVGFHVSHVLRSSSLLLEDVAGQVQSRGLDFFRSEAGKRLLADRTRNFPELQAMLVTDQRGQLLVATSLPYPPPNINYADRDYFRRHKAGEDLVVGEQLMSRSLGRRATTVSRAIRSSRGELLGVVLITLESEHFLQQFRSIQRSADEAISVLRTDGAVFVRLPELELGRRFPSAEVFAHAAAARSGSYEALGAVDGLRRLIAYETIEGYPLVVVVSQTRQAVLAPWWTFTGVVAGGLGLALALLGTASVYAFRSTAQTEILQAELERQAQTDSLTGLANHRQFMALAEKELSRLVRYGGSVSVLMMDIDHFKRINDTYGHRTGDLVLQRLAELCTVQLRDNDSIGRLGGEEFAVVLPRADGDHALEVAERLRQTIADTGVALEHGLPLHFTVSIGVATIEGPGTNIDTLLRQADHALYEAKAAGRNRVCAAWQAAPRTAAEQLS
jgi:diguanylate cyclase (GGDEF)-like protein